MVVCILNFVVCQRLLPQRRREHLAERQDIRGFERHLARNGVAVLKPRLQETALYAAGAGWRSLPSAGSFRRPDIAERKLWDQYMAAYEDMLIGTSHEFAPWYVVPADRKWFARSWWRAQ